MILWAVGWMLALAGLNLAFWALQHGILAWEAHLGGFVAGLIWGLWVPPRISPVDQRPSLA